MLADYTTLKTAEQRGIVEKTLPLRVITPMFGGGVSTSVNEKERHRKTYDPQTSIRGASIRGQLRFWWRLVHGRKEPTPAKMWEKEARIWGAASSFGTVSIAVKQDRIQIERFEVYRVEPRQDRPGWKLQSHPDKADIAYGTFPLQPAKVLLSQEDRPEPGVLHSLRGEATLTLRFPVEIANEVQDTLDAWLTFGGLGGRTRRGFGAISDGQVRDPMVLTTKLKELGLSHQLSGQTHDDPIAALAFGLGKLRRFRQGQQVGRNQGTGPRAGRSRWPEPEMIRQLTGGGAPHHLDRLVNVDKFPRAAFGMPIIFHFTPEPGLVDYQLRPIDSERMASPLILRPYPLPRGKYGCLALLLPYDHVPLELKLAELTARDGREWRVQPTLDPAEADSPKSPLRGQPDPLRAFLDFFNLPTSQEQIP